MGRGNMGSGADGGGGKEDTVVNVSNVIDGKRDIHVDPWALPEFVSNEKPWKKCTAKEKTMRVLAATAKVVLFLLFLYLFICSLDFLSSAFKLLGGKAAGQAFQQSDILSNPVTGVMIGILATVLVQSSSTSTSVVVSMVATEVIPVKEAIPIIMGANIGTSVTNTIVSMGQLGKKDDFRRAFAGATVHDIFNWLCVFILLIVEVVTDAIFGKGYLYALSDAIVNSANIQTSTAGETKLLKAITEPFTKKIVQVDKKVIQKIAQGDEKAASTSVLKNNCKSIADGFIECSPLPTNGTACEDKFSYVNNNGTITFVNGTVIQNGTLFENHTQFVNGEFGYIGPITTKYPCDYLFADTGLSDALLGIILLVVSLIILTICLVVIVKILHSLLKGSVAKVVRKTVNYECPGKASFLAGYLSILVGTGLTMAVQSSSIFTSALTPLVGVGVISLERMYPMTLGSNIGTTFTALLASLANSGESLKYGLQIALCHLFFNITGIIIWYPIPHFRKVPIAVAKILGNTTAQYRWFAFFYLLIMFLLVPAFFFGISLAGTVVFFCVFTVVVLTFLTIVIINVLQRKRPGCLPKALRTWDRLPLFMHSLDPLDRILTGCCAKSVCCRKHCGIEERSEAEDLSVDYGEQNEAYMQSQANLSDPNTKL